MKEKLKISTKNLSLLLVFSFSILLGILYIWWRINYIIQYPQETFTSLWSYLLLFSEAFSILIFASFSFAIIRREGGTLKRTFSGIKKEIPKVDIFVYTSDESESDISYTVMGCSSIDYAKKKVTIIDAANRPEIKKLAESYDCKYIPALGNNPDRVANINNAIKQTDGELVAVFDARQVPSSGFLNEVVNFFDDEKIALIQTPRNTFNLDLFQKNSYLEKYITNKNDLFQKSIEPGLANYGSTICGGTNFVFRKSSVIEAGYFPENMISEGFALSLKLQSRGYDVFYYNKPLSTSTTTEKFSDFIIQRVNWAKGNIQTIFAPENLQYILKLKPVQAFLYTIGAIYFFFFIPRLTFLLTPIVFILFNAMPDKQILAQLILFQVVYFTFKFLLYAVTSGKYRHVLFTDIYESAISPYLSMSITKMLITPSPLKNKKKLKKKKLSEEEQSIDLKSFVPLLILVVFLLITNFKGVWDLFYQVSLTKEPFIGLIWNSYNLLIILIALFITVDRPDVRKSVRIPIKARVKIINEDEEVFVLNTVNISNTGALLVSDYQIYEDSLKNAKIFMPNRGKLSFELIEIIERHNSFFYRIKFMLSTENKQPEPSENNENPKDFMPDAKDNMA